MSKTEVSGKQLKDGSVQRVDLDVATSGQSVIAKVVAGDNISISSTGADTGTGDVTVSLGGTIAADITSLDSRVDALEGDLATIQSAGAPNLSDLGEVSITSPTSGQVLKYDGTGWANAADSSFSGDYNDLSNKPTLVSALDDLSDVAITSPSTDQVLKYDGTAWVNSAAPAAGATDLDGLTDVAITSAAKGQFIVHNGTSFVNSNTIEASGAAVKPLIVKGAASQTANLQEWQDSSGAALAKVFASGRVQFGSLSNDDQGVNLVVQGTTGASAMFVQGAASRSSSSDVIFSMNRYGIAGGFRTYGDHSASFGSNSTALGGQVGIGIDTASKKGLVVKGAASQTANLFEAQDSGGYDVFSLNNGGSPVIKALNAYLYQLNTNGFGGLAGRGMISCVTYTGGTEGEYFMMSSGLGTAVPDKKLININLGTQQIGFNTAVASIGGQVQVTSAAAARKGFIVQGAASQSANMLEIQNSAGTTLSFVRPDGGFTIGSASAIGGSSYTAIQSPDDSYKTLVLKAKSGQWNSLFEVTDSSNNLRFAVGPNGNTTISNSYNGATALVVGHSTNQTGDLIYAQNNSVLKFKVDSAGTVHAVRYTETVANAFNTSLAPSSGTLTVDTSLGNAVLGALSASVTTWAFTNVPTENSKVTTVSAIVAGNTAYTYGSACSVNGTAVATGVQWFGGTAPASSSSTDVLTFVIVKDSAGTIRVLGSGQTIDSVVGSASAGIDGAGSANYLSKWTDANTIANSAIYESSGNVGIGTAVPQDKLELSYLPSSVAGNFGLGLTACDNSQVGAYIALRKTRGATAGAHGLVQNGDTLASINVYGSNGASHKIAGAIQFAVDGTPSATDNDMPTRMMFFTTPDGGTTTLERMRIAADGTIGIAGGQSSIRRLGIHGIGTDNNTMSLYCGQSGGSLTFCVYDGGDVRAPYVYSKTTASGANMFVGSDGTFYRSTSSLKYKTDVQNIEHGLNEVLQLRPVTYKGNTDGNKVFGGLIAEEVHDAGLTEFVQYAEDGTPDALAYGNMVSLAFKAIQELNAKVDALQAEKDALEARLAALENN